MKKMLLVLCALALMLVPMSAGAAMTSISDGEMEAITGQMGVSIGAIAEVDIAVTNLSYGDTDTGGVQVLGASAGTISHGAGYVNIGVGTINLRTGFRTASPKPITIDVLTANSDDQLATALGVNGKTIVRVGLPDQQLIADVGEVNIGLGSAAGAPVQSNSLGVLKVGSLTVNTYSALQSAVGVHAAGTPCQLLIWAH